LQAIYRDKKTAPQRQGALRGRSACA
jgi:hypothetical protein